MYGAFIKSARTSRGLTQVELARIVGIEQPNLSAYENDRQMPSAGVLNRIVVGCGYLLEATAGERRLICPLPGSDRASERWTTQSSLNQLGSGASASASASAHAASNDELSALKLEQVLTLADAIREAKASS